MIIKNGELVEYFFDGDDYVFIVVKMILIKIDY